jgi:translation initiation factor 2 subunit 2
MEYEELLQGAYEGMKPVEASCDLSRWKLPNIEVYISGNKTFICNFSQIVSFFRRSPDHLCKFLSKELAAYSKIEGDKLMLNRKLSKMKIEEKIKLYICKFVQCPECKKPDTELEKKNGMIFLHCLACGAKKSLGRG